MRSAIYEGTLVHHRPEPHHRFSMRLALPLLDHAEIDEVVAQHPLWARDRRNVVSHRQADHLSPAAVGDAVEAATGRRPTGPTATLAHLRTWGWLFNPIALHCCYDADDQVVAAVASVTNTPWKEQHAYVLGPPGRHEIAKALHVSPFLGMDQHYAITYTAPRDELALAVEVTEHGRYVFGASLELRRREIDRATLARVVWRYPMLTMRVSTGIHAHALRLWRKGASVHRHPKGGGEADARTADREGRAPSAA